MCFDRVASRCLHWSGNRNAEKHTGPHLARNELDDWLAFPAQSPAWRNRDVPKSDVSIFTTLQIDRAG